MRRSPSPCRSQRIAALLGLVSLGFFAVPAPAAPPASDTVLVKISREAGPADRAEIAENLNADASRSLPSGWREYTLAQPVTAAQADALVGQVDGVTDVTLPTRVHALATPNDPLFPAVNGGYQWALRNTGAWSGDVAGTDIHAVDAWQRTAGSAPVTVAVVDTGVQVTHPDLVNRIWTNPGEIAGNGVDDDGNGKVDDVQGWDFSDGDASVFDDATADRHGTHVAGVIAAQRDNGLGIAGIADNARIMPLRFIGADGSGWNYDAISAIQYAVANGARVINASFGGSSYDPALCDAISWAAGRGVTVVAAAGNNGQNLDTAAAWPAKCPEPTMLTVGAFTHTGQLASYSNRSTTHVDIAAPGDTIVSTIPGGYAYMSGTSMAAPQVVGVVAAVLGRSPQLTPAQTRQLVLDGATVAPALTSTIAGGRRLNMDGALAAVAPATAAPAPVADTTAPAAFAAGTPADGAAVGSHRPAFTWTASSDAQSGVAGYRVRVDNQVVADTTDTTAVPTADITAGTHHWLVEAYDAAGNTTRTGVRTLVVDDEAPAAFTLITPTADAQLPAGAVALRWSASADTGSALARYQVLVDGRAVTETPAGATRARVTLAAGRHTVAVQAVDLAGNSTATAPRTVTTVSARIRTPRGRATGVRVAPVNALAGTRSVARITTRRPTVARIQITRGGNVVGSIAVRLAAGNSRVTLPTANLGRGSYRLVVRLGNGEAAGAMLTVVR